MDAQAAVQGAVAIQGAIRVLELSLHLFAFLFPKDVKITPNIKYDYIVVGAGTAGCVLARRLSDDENVNVLLIERGGDPTLAAMMPGFALFTQRSELDYNYTTTDDNHSFQCYKNDVFETARGRGLGGTSNLNYLLYARGDPNDYKQWAEISGDPIWKYENVLPYFKKSERLENKEVLQSKYRRFHGTKGEMGINIFPDPGKVKYLNALKEVGYKSVLDTNGDDTLGFNFPMYNVANGKRQSSCLCFVAPVSGRENLHILRNTRVNKVIFEGKRAIGVEVTNNNKKSIIRANLEVILSAGAFNSPQILMLSGVGPQQHLKSLKIPTKVNLPVGYNLLDHVGVLVAHQTEKYDPNDAPAFNPYNPALLLLNGFIALNKTQKYPDAQLIVASSVSPQNFLNLFAFSLNTDDDISQRAYEANKEKEVLYTYILNLRPESRGRVTLRSTNPADPPEIRLAALAKAKDLNNIVRYVKDYLRIENSSYFKKVNAKRIDLAGERCEGFDKDSDEYWRCYSLCIMISMYHYCGTCSMGSVVDSNLRVMGVRGLRVADASVFPTIPSANLNAPTTMLAEAAAEMILNDLYNDSK